VTTLVALGGNALVRRGERGTAAEQLANLRATLAAVRPLLSDKRVVITHGNGPQVGNELVRHESASDEVPPLPLYLAVAQTQAEIGTLIAAALRPLTDRPVSCVVTHVRVAEDDPAFARPTKPIGPFYSEREASELEHGRGWTLVQDAGRGFRRVVPSPQPLAVVELEPIRTLLKARTLVVACGGGGIPVVERRGDLSGVDAVIDKDRASALLASGIGAKRLVVLTDAPAVLRGYRTPAEEEVPRLSAEEAAVLAPELPEGSMRPKVEACLAFVRATGGEALITSGERLADALAGRGGTWISR
jgi:carbamate kinase